MTLDERLKYSLCLKYPSIKRVRKRDLLWVFIIGEADNNVVQHSLSINLTKTIDLEIQFQTNWRFLEAYWNNESINASYIVYYFHPITHDFFPLATLCLWSVDKYSKTALLPFKCCNKRMNFLRIRWHIIVWAECLNKLLIISVRVPM